MLWVRTIRANMWAVKVLRSFLSIRSRTSQPEKAACFALATRLCSTAFGSLRFHGLGVDAYDRQTQGRSPQAEVLEPGYKYNMTDISAALGISQLARVEEFNARRAELAARYAERLEDVDDVVNVIKECLSQ